MSEQPPRQSFRAAPTEARLAFADGLRAIAAFWVVLFHLAEGGHLPHLFALIPVWLKVGLFDAGHLGVAVFFVLSGFVISLTARTVVFDAAGSARFVLRRFVRLAPVYYIAVAVGVFAALFKAKVLQQPADVPTVGEVLAHLAYVQAILEIPHINTVFWTLGIEIQFYLVFVLHCWLANVWCRGAGLGLLLALLTTSAALALAWPAGVVTGSLWPGGFIEFWYSFAAGALLGMALNDRRALYIAAAMGLALLFIGLVRSDEFALVAGLTTLALLLAVLRQAMPRWLHWSWIQHIGLWSYSLYLFHNTVTGVAIRLLRRVMPAGLATDLFILVTIPLLCIAVAWAAFRLLEWPSILWSRRIALPRLAPVPNMPASSPVV